MTYATKIAELRAQTGDIKRRIHVDWTGDGSTTVFQMPDDTFPVLDDSTTYVVKVNSTIQVEDTDYALDKYTGTITFVGAPTNGHSVEIDSIMVYLTDADWLAVINDTIRSLGQDFWKEFIDSTNFTTTANMLSLDMTSSRPNCIDVYEFQFRTSTSENWVPAEEICNWRFDRDNGVLYIGSRDAFTTANYPIRIRGLETYTLGTAVTDTIDVQNRFMTIVEYGAIARYWRWRYKHVIDLVTKMSTESTRTPLQEIIMLSDRFDRLFETEKARLKPMKPARIIPRYLQGGGRP